MKILLILRPVMSSLGDEHTGVLLAGETVEEIVCQPVGPGRGCDELDLGSRGFSLFRVERKGKQPTKGAV